MSNFILCLVSAFWGCRNDLFEPKAEDFKVKAFITNIKCNNVNADYNDNTIPTDTTSSERPFVSVQSWVVKGKDILMSVTVPNDAEEIYFGAVNPREEYSGLHFEGQNQNSASGYYRFKLGSIKKAYTASNEMINYLIVLSSNEKIQLNKFDLIVSCKTAKGISNKSTVPINVISIAPYQKNLKVGFRPLRGYTYTITINTPGGGQITYSYNKHTGAETYNNTQSPNSTLSYDPSLDIKWIDLDPQFGSYTMNTTIQIDLSDGSQYIYLIFIIVTEGKIDQLSLDANIQQTGQNTAIGTVNIGFNYFEQFNYSVIMTFDENPNSYLPREGDMIRVTSTFHPTPPPGGSVIFELTQADKFVFSDGTKSPKIVSIVGNSAFIDIQSLTFWGVAKVKVTYSPTAGVLITDEKQLPVDTDSDGIADSWEMKIENGGSLALGRNSQDGGWDEERSAGNNNNGDGYSKLNEYKGVKIGLSSGTNYFRMKANKKEIFLDIGSASEGVFARDRAAEQLDLKVYEFNTLFGEPQFYGNNQYGKRIKILDTDTDPDIPMNDGILVENGKRTGSPLPRLGLTKTPKPPGPMINLFILVKVIRNLFDAGKNTYPETFNIQPPWPVATSTGYPNWVAVYDGTDLNNDGDTDDSINFLDLLAPAETSPSKTNNDAIDGISATVTMQQVIQRTTLHELGHAVGMWPERSNPNPDCADHPCSGESVMRTVWGPAFRDTFSAEDVAQMKLK